LASWICSLGTTSSLLTTNIVSSDKVCAPRDFVCDVYLQSTLQKNSKLLNMMKIEIIVIWNMKLNKTEYEIIQVICDEFTKYYVIGQYDKNM
jgi:hypothetical protein